MRLISIESRQAPFIDAYKKTALAYGFDLILAQPRNVPPSAFERFSAVYKHYSDNSIEFELSCFRRYFDALALAEGNSEIIISDTDQIILSPPQSLPSIYFEPDLIVGSRGKSKGIPEFDISPHFSKWPVKALHRFTDFIIYTYSENSEILEEEYKRRKAIHGRAAVSDMTLFNMFIMEEKPPFCDSNSLLFSSYVDHNFSMDESSDGTFCKELGFKAFRKDRSGQIVLVTASDRFIRPISIHFQGRAKVAAKAFSEGRMVEARMRLAMITTARRLRALLP